MVNDIVDGIATKLYELFGDDYEINIDEQKQDFRGPCFFITEIFSTQNLVVSNRYWRAHKFDIQYHPKSECGITREVNEAANKMLLGLEYINIKNDLTRGTNISYEVHDGVLHFFVNYDLFILKELDKVPYMKTLSQSQKLKGGMNYGR